MYLISIIVPVYNVESYLSKCLESIINQTYKNIEIILIDDGSTDDSGKICDEYAAKDNRINIIHKTNGGVSDARNSGLEIAQGEYIGFVDSDDYIELDMYETLLNFLLNNNLDVVMCSSYKVKNKNIIKCKDFKPYIFNSKEEIIEDLLINKYKGSPITVWNKLFKRGVLKEVRFIKDKEYEDIYFLLEWIKFTNRFGRIPYHGYYYIIRSGSITNPRYFNDKIFDLILSSQKNLQEIKKLYPNAINAAEFKLFRAYISTANQLIACIDINEHKEFCKKLQNSLKKYLFNISKNPYLTWKQKLKLILLSLNFDVYAYLKK